jgi:DNA-binding transcriptional regulator YiaG
VSYVYRDPARNTPARLDDLAARDARRALLERPADRDAQTAARRARIAEFTRLRVKERMTTAQAADAMGINRSTGRGYERARRRRQ